MAQTLAPDVRSRFAKRLKAIRSQRGFDRARYFAKSLGIEENRYTRYERAEVEPSLTLIHKMCETLQVTPNELLGFVEFMPARVLAPGLAEPALEENALASDRIGLHGAGSAADREGSLAWRLAAQTIAIRQEHAKPKAASDPLDAMRETAALYRRLQAEPFETVAEIVGDPPLKSIDAKRKSLLVALIQSYTESVSQMAVSRTRS